MPKVSYSFDNNHCFIIEQYNDAAPFASFLPGIAGVTGIPAWVFYVNRGQAISSFGVRNKDGAILEFFPADKAYQLTASRGFRTFLKISDGVNSVTHEPFQRRSVGYADALSTLTHQIVGRQPFAAETNRVPSRHGDADLLLNSTVLGLKAALQRAITGIA